MPNNPVRYVISSFKICMCLEVTKTAFPPDRLRSDSFIIHREQPVHSFSASSLNFDWFEWY